MGCSSCAKKALLKSAITSFEAAQSLKASKYNKSINNSSCEYTYEFLTETIDRLNKNKVSDIFDNKLLSLSISVFKSAANIYSRDCNRFNNQIKELESIWKE